MTAITQASTPATPPPRARTRGTSSASRATRATQKQGASLPVPSSLGSTAPAAQGLSRVAGLLPLVARPAARCPTISQRVRAVADAAGDAQTARAEGDRGEAASAATRALAGAVRIAAECGQPQLAERWSRGHIELYAGLARPLTTTEAQRMLAPVITRARLQADRDLDEVIATLELLLRATRDQVAIPLTDVPNALEGITLPLGNIRGSLAQRRGMVAIIGSQLLTTATSGLAARGRWSEAVAFARRYEIGDRLDEGRQVLIADRIAAGDLETAGRLITESRLRTAWEETVAACLTALCTQPRYRDAAISAMLSQYRASLEISPPPGDAGVRFQVRQGLLAVTIAAGTWAGGNGIRRHAVEEIASRLVTAAIGSDDGYVARDILRCQPVARAANRRQQASLARIVDRAGLDGGVLAAGGRRDRLQSVVDQALEVLEQTL